MESSRWQLFCQTLHTCDHLEQTWNSPVQAQVLLSSTAGVSVQVMDTPLRVKPKWAGRTTLTSWLWQLGSSRSEQPLSLFQEHLLSACRTALSCFFFFNTDIIKLQFKELLTFKAYLLWFMIYTLEGKAHAFFLKLCCSIKCDWIVLLWAYSTTVSVINRKPFSPPKPLNENPCNDLKSFS